MQTFLDFVRAHQPPNHNVTDNLEIHFQAATDDASLDRLADPAHPPHQYTIPADGDSAPILNDRPIAYNPELITAYGISGWDWRNGQTVGCGSDFDFGHGPKGLDAAGITLIDGWADKHPAIQNSVSKGGHGRHWYIPCDPLPAKTRADHKCNCEAIMDRLSADLSVDLRAHACTYGGYLYVWARNPAPNGFKLLTAATATLQVDPPPPAEPKNKQTTKLGPAHKKLVKWLADRSLGDYDGRKNLVNTHTAAIARAYGDEKLNLKGDFETVADGGKLPTDRNCCLYPMPKGTWICVRYEKAEETGEGWSKNANGHYTCRVNHASPAGKADWTEAIVCAALKRDKFFHTPDGFAYVETLRRGRLETLPVISDAYRRLLRMTFRRTTHLTAKNEWLKNAVDELCACAIEEGPEQEVFVRIAWHDGKLYVDLGDPDRKVIEVDKHGYQLIDHPPVRFYRSDRMQTLPMPEPGGTFDLLRPLCNVSDKDWPLFVGALLGIYHPTGPYAVILLIGGDGHAKSSLARLVLLLMDPNLAKGSAPPDSGEDLLLMARQRWLLFLDNVSELKGSMQDALCRLSTGGANERRTKYKDADTSCFVAKRPIIITSIRDPITRRDLDSRTIKFDLPAVSEEDRKSERDFDAMVETVRPQVFGAILTALSGAIRNLPTTKVPNLPRLADWAVFVSAVEAATGLPEGSILATYRDARNSALKEILDGDLAQKILNLESFRGTGKELCQKLGLPISDLDVQKFVGELRDLQSTLESQGIKVVFKRSHGRKLIEIGKVTT